MSMQALNHLVAQSIVDPSVASSFRTGRIGEVLAQLEFEPEMRARLAVLEADSFAEFAVLAYRAVKAVEATQKRFAFPSPLEGLVERDARGSEEQVA